ncbi:MAG: peptidylprolyl isomerase [Panacagrimonas sp.]
MLHRLRNKIILALVAATLPLVSHAEVLDRIIVVVNEGVVLESDLERETQNVMTQLKGRDIEAPEPSLLRAQVLERLILTRIQTQRAQQAGVRVDDRELNEVLNNIAQQNKMTLAQFAEMIRQEGGDFLAIREQVREEVLVARLKQREVDGRVNITDQDIALYLAGDTANDDTEYRVSHILVAIPEGATPEQREAARLKADGLHERLKKGEAFGQIAASSSDGQQALQGGDLDWRKADNLPVLFLQAARRLKTDEISPVLEAAGGFHIIKLVDSRGTAERKTIEETRSRHILLKPDALRTEDQARAQIRELEDRLNKGEDFGKLATEFSDDPGSKVGGGDLGWQPSGVFAPEFQAALDPLKPGERSAPFHTQFGWHLAEVIERRTRDVTEEARRARARQSLQGRKAAEEYDTWLRRLRSEAYVEFRGPDGQVVKPT